jgi:hypothetical protein
MMKNKKDLGISQVPFATKPPNSIIAQSKAVCSKAKGSRHEANSQLLPSI